MQRLQGRIILLQDRQAAGAVGLVPPVGDRLPQRGFPKTRQVFCQIILTRARNGVYQGEKTLDVGSRANPLLQHGVGLPGRAQDVNRRFELPGRVVCERQQVAEFHVLGTLDDQELGLVDQLLVAPHQEQQPDARFRVEALGCSKVAHQRVELRQLRDVIRVVRLAVPCTQDPGHGLVDPAGQLQQPAGHPVGIGGIEVLLHPLDDHIHVLQQSRLPVELPQCRVARE